MDMTDKLTAEAYQHRAHALKKENDELMAEAHALKKENDELKHALRWAIEIIYNLTPDPGLMGAIKRFNVKGYALTRYEKER